MYLDEHVNSIFVSLTSYEKFPQQVVSCAIKGSYYHPFFAVQDWVLIFFLEDIFSYFCSAHCFLCCKTKL